MADDVFAAAYEAAFNKHKASGWNALTPGQRREEIYREMRRIDRDNATPDCVDKSRSIDFVNEKTKRVA
ncbi:MAG: hypothetical protein KGQ40_00515 [Rhodospirillales bacterium]|nr:hypothetical protein [Rhodospirillales bacterium]